MKLGALLITGPASIIGSQTSVVLSYRTPISL